jgi:hypothetical protein
MKNLPLRAALAILLGLLGISPLPAATLEGRWKLVEQSAGSGGANVASPEAPLRLEFRLSGSSPAGRIWTAEEKPRPFPWPSFSMGSGSAPVEIEQLIFAPAGDSARTVYRVKMPGGDSVLRVEEEYRLSDGGRALAGTVSVTSLEEGAARGTYRIHRRFEREP